MTETRAETPSLRVIDDLSVREAVATNTVTGLLVDGTLLVTLAAQRTLPVSLGAPPTQGPVAQVSARLALTPTAAVDLVNLLTSLLAAIPGVRFTPTEPAQPQ